MANTRRKIKVLVDRNELRAQGLTLGKIVDAQVSGNRATPFRPGLRTFHLRRGEWAFASAEEVVNQALTDHKLQSKDDPAVGDGSISPDGDNLDASAEATSGPVQDTQEEPADSTDEENVEPFDEPFEEPSDEFDPFS